MEPDLNEEIQKLKEEGNSLRKIAATFHLSHETVRKRLKAIEGKDRVSTEARGKELTASTIKKEKVSTGSRPRKSRASEEIDDTVNLKQTSTDTGESVNPSGNHSRGPLRSVKGVYQGVDSEIDDLFGAIKDFLESKGIEVYRMQVAQEAYQVDRNGQIVRFYVQKSK